ncbi:MAG: YceI family protein, partial [bacterium]
MGAGAFWGKFDEVTGSIVYFGGDKAPEFDVSIAIESVHSGNENLDKHLKSPDFFNAKEFPAMTFKSTGIKKLENGMYEVTGDLSMHGVTKPITANIEVTGHSN